MLFGLPFITFTALSFYLKLLLNCIMINLDNLTIDLNKWTKPMLIEFIFKKTTPSSIKIIGDLFSMIDATSLKTDSQSTSCLMEVAHILKSVISALDPISTSNLK